MFPIWHYRYCWKWQCEMYKTVYSRKISTENCIYISVHICILWLNCIARILFIELNESGSFSPTCLNSSMDSWIERTVCCLSSKMQNLSTQEKIIWQNIHILAKSCCLFLMKIWKIVNKFHLICPVLKNNPVVTGIMDNYKQNCWLHLWC
jgi:hypothetical protein